jgi:hypothetical protein
MLGIASRPAEAPGDAISGKRWAAVLSVVAWEEFFS